MSLLPRRLVALVLGGWLLALLAESGPHLVHHLFDIDPEPECEYLAAADHAPAAVTEVPPVVAAWFVDADVVWAPTPHLPGAASRQATTRAPPAAPLARI